ncbi:MAG: isoaspartyl peptidase/L-asparaginase [Pirellulaceae bacterium]
MDGRTHRGAGVAALRNVRHPSLVALKLLEQTNRVLIVGEGALAFARANGFFRREPADGARAANLAPLEADSVADR